ncbi:MAG: lysophospholipid acyltransferase family protein [Candidatus Cloacimonetes bacterium]|nr:lysophospholipid acyltransferase family protein [Candidatus Cloacimonadota bacterium]
MRLIKATLRFEVKNQPDCEPVVYAFWHRNQIYLGLLRIGDPMAVMVSASKDGELIAGPSARMGYAVVRGSSSRQGSQALKEMLRYAKTIPVAITPDGPRGPVGTINPGLFYIALLAKIPIVAVACDSNREWIFNSWDKFRFPKPFARIKVVYSDPIYVRSKAEIPEAEISFRKAMADIERDF